MEKRDLYDKNRNLTGQTYFKGDSIPEGLYQLVVIIVMENKDGRFLIQKRVPQKDGKWASTGGHPKAGETSYAGILTEVKEEIGLDISNEDIKLVFTIQDEDSFCDLYYVKMDIDLDKIICQKEEVESVKLASLDEIRQMINDDIFHKVHGKILPEVVKEVYKNKTHDQKRLFTR